MKRLNWETLQHEFNFYKLENTNKTLQDFCKLKKINYSTACNKIKVGDMKRIKGIYDKAKRKSFNTTLESQATNLGTLEALTTIEKVKQLDKIISMTTRFIDSIKTNRQKPYRNVLDAVRSLTIAMKCQIELLKFDKEPNLNSNELQESEDAFFNEMLNAKIKEPAIN